MKFYKQALLCAIVMALTAGPASAQWGGYGGWGGYAGYGGYYGSYIQPFVAAPPYFAVHPPVYYGKRYTRPYGESPFAAPPQLQTNPSFAPKPAAEHSLIISNPYLSTCAAPTYGQQSTPEFVPQTAPADTNVAPERIQVPASPVVQQRLPKPLVIDNPYFQAPPALVTRQGN